MLPARGTLSLLVTGLPPITYVTVSVVVTVVIVYGVISYGALWTCVQT